MCRRRLNHYNSTAYSLTSYDFNIYDVLIVTGTYKRNIQTKKLLFNIKY